MWVLVVLNSIVGLDSDEVKVTRYSEYNTEFNCEIEAAILTAEFTQGETAVCVKGYGE